MVYQQNTMATASHVYVVCGNLWTFSLCRVVPVRDTNKRSNVSCVCYDCFSKVCLIFSSPPRQCLQANTYTGGRTTLPTPPSRQLTPHQLTSPQQSDFIKIPNGGDDVQPTPPLSGYQSNSGEYCMLSIDDYVCMYVGASLWLWECTVECTGDKWVWKHIWMCNGVNIWRKRSPLKATILSFSTAPKIYASSSGLIIDYFANVLKASIW